MVTKWSAVGDKEKYGVVVCNFNLDIVYANRLQLFVGDTVYITEENGNWYYGCSTKNQNVFGVFPKSYIALKECVVDKTGPQEIVYPREPPIVQEITAVLREWGAIWKNMFICRNPNFEAIRLKLYELIDMRSQVMSGNLPIDELKELKRKITTTIDHGNALLLLDLVVRDEQGNILNPDATSTIELYFAHEKAAKRIKQEMLSNATESRPKKAPTSHYTYNLYVNISNFVCNIGEDSELLMTLIITDDGKDYRFISENYYVKWDKMGLKKDFDGSNNLRVLFCDLANKDLCKEKVLFVCQVVRLGAMELKEQDPQQKFRTTLHPGKKAGDILRRPFGVAAMDITDIFTPGGGLDEDKELFIPFVQCGEKDSLDAMIKKIAQKSDFRTKELKDQGLFVSLKVLHGDLQQVRENHSHLVSPLTPVARKMGFPEVILPGDVRNDLYLTIVSADFSSRTCSAKNIEVSVTVCNDKGQTLPNVLTVGAGTDLTSEYKSVVYYHEEKPKWMETVKVSVPIEDFYNSHLKFMFKHRSSNESKDKNEKPFGFAFVRLMNENGTTLIDQNHELLFYKIDSRRFDEADSASRYLKLPSTKAELELRTKGSVSQMNNYKAMMSQFNIPGLTLVLKDSFTISTVVCSTKLTQNVDLLGLLKWSPRNCANDQELKSCLLALMKVDGEEIVKFLTDTLDSLFKILMEKDSDEFNDLLFKALMYIIGLISDRKYHHFRPVLDVYIKENFSATLAYTKLIVMLKEYIDSLIDGTVETVGGRESRLSLLSEGRNSYQKSSQENAPLQPMKSLEFLFKFIVRSRFLFSTLYGGKDRVQFERAMTELLQTLTSLMGPKSRASIIVQAACLKYFPAAIPDILTVYDGKDLSVILTELINNVPVEKLKQQKMTFILDIIHSECLFRNPECRLILLPVFNDHVRCLMEGDQELPSCVQVLSDILTLLHGRDAESVKDDITDVMLTVLRTIIQRVIKMGRDNALVGNLVAILIAIFRQMTPYHYDIFMDHFRSKRDLLDFTMEVIMVFKDLVESSVYPKDWNEMIMLQSRVVLNSLKEFARRIKDRFLEPFEQQVWNNFFHCAIAFLTQKSLQLENFSEIKRKKILSRYKEMRSNTAFIIRSMWFSLGQYKINFVPDMIGPFLEMALIPELELRKAIIPIFFDMMQCEFFSERFVQPGGEIGANNGGNFKKCEHEMITQLDKLVEGGRGDEEFKNLFRSTLQSLCEQYTAMREQGFAFVNTVVRLMKRLLEYRAVIKEENKENRMLCIVNLLEFYHEIKRNEMYIRYLYKLCDLHLDCDNYTEAAYALILHTRLLNWSDDPLPQPLKNEKYPQCETNRELKEKLYKDIVDYFDKGKLWEEGLRFCEELVVQYKNETVDYNQLSALHLLMSQFYDNIMKQIRHKPEYFRVAYCGSGFPAFLRNKTFVHRGNAYERLNEFSSRLLNHYPNAQLLTSLSPPGAEITESDGQYLQINKVDPVMNLKAKFKDKPIHHQILKYYEVNEVQKFSYSRPIKQTPGGGPTRVSDNEFANIWVEKTTLVTSYPFPGILTRLLVTETNTFFLSPLENAIETMEVTNTEIKNLILQHIYEPNLPLSQLTMRLQGVVDAAVNGGIMNYENAFFTPEFAKENSTTKDRENIEKLKNLIASQIPLLDIGIEIHEQRAAPSLRPLHDHIKQLFQKLKQSVESKYGRREPPRELRTTSLVKIRRNASRNDKKAVSTPESKVEQRDVNKHASIISLPGSQLKPMRSMSVWVRHNSGSQSQSNTNTMTKLKKQSSRDGDLVQNQRKSSTSHSQWYLEDTPSESDTKRASRTSANSSQPCPIIELTEQLTPQRPLRHNRPSSGQFLHASHALRTASYAASSSSLSTQASEPDLTEDKPPPLPVKASSVDYTNLPDVNGSTDWTIVKPKHNSVVINSKNLKNRPPPPLPQSSPRLSKSPSISYPCDNHEDIPPEIPKKPSRPATFLAQASIEDKTENVNLTHLAEIPSVKLDNEEIVEKSSL